MLPLPENQQRPRPRQGQPRERAYPPTRQMPAVPPPSARSQRPPRERPAERRPPRDSQRGRRRPPPPPPRRKWGPGRVIGSLLLVIVLVIAGCWIYLETNINRVDAIEDYEGRPAAAEGTNWLIVGSDKRQDITAEERKRLHTGKTECNCTDTIMIAHLPDNSTKPTLLSIPRDFRPDGGQRINAAYGSGGGKSLVKAVEQFSDLRIDHYAEIGFGGFADIVDAVGGVEINVKQDIVDKDAGANLKKGKQELDGAESLAFVRSRKAQARGDLDRIANQRTFLGALANEIASPWTLINPFQLFPLVGSIPDALTIDSGDHVHHLLALGWALRGVSSGGVVTTSLPTDSSATYLDQAKAEQLFDALRNDESLPDSVITN